MSQNEAQVPKKRRRRRTPALLKTLLRTSAVRGTLCWLTALYIRSVYWTSRWQTVGEAIPQAEWNAGRPFILAFWHNRLLMMPYCWRTRIPMNMLISHHRDGELIARTIAHFHLGAIRGSAGNNRKGGDKMSGKGGVQALRSMARAAASGEALGITPDGPRGPLMRASEGVAAISKLTGLPIIPCAYSVSNARVLKSWDRFLLALPFSKGVFVWGSPITVDKSTNGPDLSSTRMLVEAELNRVSAEADRLVGREPIGTIGPHRATGSIEVPTS